ncbi:hypothetical protein GCM10022204_23140 [Microlunatus aurantiacus]|uniref:Pentapeptide repeat-containing protein n=1 Tax=Microlunatus aurantiacus TaxID=446786 RepID=A0ABP7DJ05_9ACTN
MADDRASEPYSESSTKIREAGKWLLGAAAAVGAAVIAGSQLSDIGSLPVCKPFSSISCARLPIAVVAAGLALVAIAFILWNAVRLLLPIGLPLGDLARAWDRSVKTVNGQLAKKRVGPLRADIRFFFDHPEQIPLAADAVVGSLSALKTEWETARDDLQSARRALQDPSAHPVTAPEEAEEAEQKFRRWDAAVKSTIQTAQYELLLGRFRALLWKLLPATFIAATGLAAFAWASNPGPVTASLADAQLAGADLRNAKLVGVTLDGANLTRANLAGADLGGASVRDVAWTGATCPDGTKSDSNGTPATCLGHLSP